MYAESQSLWRALSDHEISSQEVGRNHGKVDTWYIDLDYDVYLDGPIENTLSTLAGDRFDGKD